MNMYNSVNSICTIAILNRFINICLYTVVYPNQSTRSDYYRGVSFCVELERRREVIQ